MWAKALTAQRLNVVVPFGPSANPLHVYTLPPMPPELLSRVCGHWIVRTLSSLPLDHI